MDSAPLAVADSPPAAPTPPPPQYVALVFPTPDENDPIPMHLRKVWTCTAGQVIAQLISGDAALPPEASHLPPMRRELVQLGKNVRWDGAGEKIIAEKAGRIRLQKNNLSIEESLELREDLTAADGRIDFPGTVLVRKNVLDLVKLSASGNITIQGTVEAADIRSQANLVVNHGICGKDHGHVSGQTVTARFVSGANITAIGDVVISKEVANSRIICGGDFSAGHAVILSGHISAAKSISIGTVGTPAGIHVLLELSLPPELLAHAAQATADLKEYRHNAELIRSQAAPLLRHAKSLSPQEKEKAAGLLRATVEAEARRCAILKSLSEPRAMLAELMKGFIHIAVQLHPGAVIRIAGLETRVTKAYRGPLKIMLNSDPAIHEFTMINEYNHPVGTLHASQAPDYALVHMLALAKL